MSDENPTTEKAGRRHSEGDLTLLAGIHGKAGEIAAAALALGHVLPVEVQTIKGDDLPATAEPGIFFTEIKAAGDMALDIRVAFGGPFKNRAGKDGDSQGEYFDERTDFDLEHFPTPPVAYYHGFDENGKQMPRPVFVGKTDMRGNKADGHWLHAPLKKNDPYAAKVYKAALEGRAVASPGTIGHLIRRSADGHLDYWPIAEISVWDGTPQRRPANPMSIAVPALKALYAEAGMDFPNLFTDATPQTDATGATGPVAVALRTPSGKTAMETNNMDAELEAKIAEAVAAAMKAQTDAAAVEAERAAKEQARVDAAVAAERAKWQAESAKTRRLPMGEQAPAQPSFAQTYKYDGLDVNDLSFLATVLSAAKSERPNLSGVSAGLLQSLAIRIAEDKTVAKRRDGTEVPLGDLGRQALKAYGLDPLDVLNAAKADELNYSTQPGFGDEWVSVQYSDRLWESIRYGTFVLDEMPSVVVPQGAESIIIPVQGADMTWYKVAQAADNNATTLVPNATVTASKMATTNKTLTVAKLGARVIFTGELAEDSVIPWAAQLRRQMEASGAEVLENVIINGDTDTTNSTNINAIDTTPAATDAYLLFNGFRKSPLVTTTANSRSASGSLADTDYLATVKLMGAAGKNARDHSKVTFIPDMNTYWKSLELANLKTKEVFDNYTLLNGELTSIWNYRVRPSGFMHANSAKLMANSAGKIDADTDGNNTLGAILAVRWDQWLFGYKRRMTIETTRFANSDSTEITALTRVGMIQRDTEASAITYNVGVA